MKELPIEVLSFSVDQSDEAWKNAINKMNLPLKNQYLLRESLEAELCKYYSVTGVPRFFIIDSESRLNTAKAKRPSDTSLSYELIGLMKIIK